MIRILATGDWPEGSVTIRWTRSTRAVAPAVEQAIARAWADAMSRRGDVQLFDGPMCRLESFQFDIARLDLSLSRTSYKTFFGTNMSNPKLADEYGADVLANPVGLSVALRCADDQLLFGRRGARVAYYPRRVHPFAGALEPRDGLEIFDDVRRELLEELSLDAHSLDALRCIGIVEDRSLRQPEMIFAATTTRTSLQLERALDQKEHHGVVRIPASGHAVEGALRAPRELTPVAIATLLLWGRINLGEAWFDANQSNFTGSAGR